MNSIFEKAYEILPPYFQNLAVSCYGWNEKKIRLGKNFSKYYDSLITSEFADNSFIEEYQEKQISNLLNQAFLNTKYYSNLFSDLGIHPSDINDLQSLKKIPLLDKEKIIKNYNSLISSNLFLKKLKIKRTSGTTGKALKFITTEDAIAFQWAIWWRHRRRFGFYPGQWHVNFTGKSFVSNQTNTPPFWRIDYARKQVLVSLQQLVPSKVSSIVNFLNKKKINYFTGYPSIVFQFCDLIESQNLSLDYKPILVTLGAEKCHQFQKKLIARVTGAFVTDQYGLSEGCLNASKCHEGHYHVDWEFGLIECIDGVRNPDGTLTGKIVASGFSNEAFPFIRYLTGDVGTWAPKGFKCTCGRESPVIFDIDGRMEDFVITPEGNKIMRFDYLFKQSDGIKEAQIIQDQLGSFKIKYVPREGFKYSELSEIKLLTKKMISPTIKVEFERVDAIEVSSNGKYRSVISRVNN